MYLCYVDESGTPDIPGNTSHFVLCGVSLPISKWKQCETRMDRIKIKYGLIHQEIHTAWILRKYVEQSKIPDFEKLSYKDRRSAVESLRKTEILRLQTAKNSKQLKQTKKNYKNTNAYIHLTYDERKNFILEVADCISTWEFARLFAECIDKIFFDPNRTPQTIEEQSFEQLVSRFEHYLENMNRQRKCYGLIIHDNNTTVSKKHTELMKLFHQKGTLWTAINNIIETPLFVDSELTSMIQIADVCGYALRRYLENGEEEIFDKIFLRADRKDGLTVGVRHFTKPGCQCKICATHKK